MILLVGILIGIIAGLVLSIARKRSYSFPVMGSTWLVVLAFVPQFIAFYLPATRTHVSSLLASISLLGSQALLLLFCWLNRRLSGIWVLALGLVLNLLVISLNSGFMPISPQTAGRLVSPEVLKTVSLGSRFGFGKDILLLPSHTRLVWLSDRLLPPKNFFYQVAFSLGDVVVAAGAFWLTALQGKPVQLFINKHG